MWNKKHIQHSHKGCQVTNDNALTIKEIQTIKTYYTHSQKKSQFLKHESFIFLN